MVSHAHAYMLPRSIACRIRTCRTFGADVLTTMHVIQRFSQLRAFFKQTPLRVCAASYISVQNMACSKLDVLTCVAECIEHKEPSTQAGDRYLLRITMT
jgi:hypothetical protein